jgi:membrane-associated protein
MQFRFILVVLFSLTAITVYAQQKVAIKLVSQYGTPVKQFIVEANGVATEYKAKEGIAEIVIPLNDSVTIRAKDYEPTSFVYESLKDKTTIQLKKKFTWKDLVSPEFYINYGGLWLMLFIVFAETGLLAGFFLPGDSLLFVAGIYSKNLVGYLIRPSGTGSEFVDLVILMLIVSICGIAGNILGYWFGQKSGPFLFSRKDTFLFRKKNLIKAKDFYDKHGGQAIVFARFLPIVRTFAPIIAGIVGMDRKKFMYYNIVGCVAWVCSMLLAGHYLYKLFLNKFNFDLKEHLEAIVIGIILVTTLPVIYKLFFGKKEPESSAQN